MKVTSDTITDEQIRELLALGEIDLGQFHQATDDIVGWTDAAYRRARTVARARCAEIWNAVEFGFETWNARLERDS